jgi:hypothetical protein
VRAGFQLDRMDLRKCRTGSSEPRHGQCRRPRCVACGNSLQRCRYSGRATVKVLRDEPRSPQSMYFGNLERGRTRSDQLRVDAWGERTQYEVSFTPTYGDPQPPGALVVVQCMHRPERGIATDRIDSPVQRPLGRRRAACPATRPALGESAISSGRGQEAVAAHRSSLAVDKGGHASSEHPAAPRDAHYSGVPGAQLDSTYTPTTRDRTPGNRSACGPVDIYVLSSWPRHAREPTLASCTAAGVQSPTPAAESLRFLSSWATQHSDARC